MESEISHVKRARLLSQNQIREIVMDSDSEEEKYYASEVTEDNRSHTHLCDSLPTLAREFDH
jgi:hypothetical protein